MAYLIPDWTEIDNLPQPLRRSEKKLVDALLAILSDDWTIYVQPHINGINPDVVIYSPLHGIAIFEVKEWSLGMYRINVHENRKSNGSEHLQYEWVAIKENGQEVVVRCPYKQVENYKQAIMRFEMPELNAEIVSKKIPQIYSIIATFVYFYGVTRDYLTSITNLSLIEGKYHYGLGDDDLVPGRLIEVLESRHVIREKGQSKFANWMVRRNPVIQNLFYPAKHGKTDLKYLNKELTPKQKGLLLNTPNEKRRIIGVAGSGKTLVLVHKAVQAAREKKSVLFVMFNITMANYLRDLISRLCSFHGPHVHRYVRVIHYHRLFSETYDQEYYDNETEPICDEDENWPDHERNPIDQHPDVLLIDEGQDFEQGWVQRLISLCKPDVHVMYVEDDRQDIYVRSKKTLTGFIGRPNRLDESHRIPIHLSYLANALYEYFNIASESGPITSVEKSSHTQPLFPAQWHNESNYEDALEALKQDLTALSRNGRLGQASDSAILFCQVKHGWDINDWLTQNLKISRNKMFETRSEANRLRSRFEALQNLTVDELEVGLTRPKGGSAWQLNDEQWQEYKRELTKLRRYYKMNFHMRSEGIKLSTIHSFKGWELERLFILFDPDEDQLDASIPLLYTALTRSQNHVTIYNVNSKVAAFGEYVIERGLASRWQTPS